MKELFEPSSIAVIGAAREEMKVGHIVLKNLLDSGFKGRLFPVNPKADEILGLKCYPRVTDVPETVELAVIVVPNTFVPKVMDECGQKGVKAAIVITAGFKETGKVGAELEHKLGEVARQHGIRVLGPNCLGIINTQARMNATFTNNYPRVGSIAISSQSGAICSTVLDWAADIKVGFSKFVSVGNKVDVDEADLLRFLRDDPATKVIGMYIEGTDRGREFMNEAFATSVVKPIIALKSGRTSTGAKAASSHTGALSGSDKVYGAAMEQSGIVRAKNIEELFDLLLVFATMPLPPEGGGVAIVTNAGGLGVLAADACGDYGIPMASFSAETVAKLKSYLPEEANFYNPVDVIGDARTDRYEFAMRTVMEDKNVSSMLVMLAPTDLVDIPSVAKLVASFAGKTKIPLAAAFVGGQDVSEGIVIMREAGIPCYESPDRGIRALAAASEYSILRGIKSKRTYAQVSGDKDRVREVLSKVRGEGRLALSEEEGKEILKAYGVPVPNEGIATDAEEAVVLAEQIGFPVVMKIESPDILHKTDVGGVVVGVKGADEVRSQFALIMARVRTRLPEAKLEGVSIQKMLSGREVIVGMVRDEQFGPVITFGLGGIFVEIMKDVAQRVTPIANEEMDEMVRSIRAYPILAGARGRRPADMAALKNVIARVAQAAEDFPEILELEINPVILMDEGEGCGAVDALVTLRREKP
ncbi:MAG TPA: acetate--CoA ligase family protein [Methanomassiliicoccales archaeon]|nr:acetate--CoA ligase family protein [Methanomassiliicoccales archaeon]